MSANDPKRTSAVHLPDWSPAGSAGHFFIIIVIRHETTAAAPWALLLIVRTLFNDAITVAVVCYPQPSAKWQFGAKRMELASELVPEGQELALLVNHSNPNAEPDAADLRTAADALGKRMVVLKASSETEVEAAFVAAAQRNVAALFINIDPFFFGHRQQFVLFAARYRLPTIYPLRDFVSAGGLMSYGANFANAWRQGGLYAGKILRGAKPADLPVLQPTAAKALGLNIPPKLLALADDVIE